METKREIGTFLSMQLLFIGAIGMYTKHVFGMFLIGPVFSLFYLISGIALIVFLVQLRGLEYFSKILAFFYIGVAAATFVFNYFGTSALNMADVYLNVLIAGIFYYIGFSKKYKRHYNLA